MPLIEVVPNTSAAKAPGWAYVPDTGYDPSKAAIVPSGARSRQSRTAAAAASGSAARGSELSVGQQTKISKRLAELERDNNRDVKIEVQRKARDGGLHGKMTPGVRKIVTSAKTFANHLADEEALLDKQQPAIQRVQGEGSSAAATPQRQATPASASTSTKRRRTTKTTVDEPVDAMDEDPFLKSRLPPYPTQAELDALISAPPLSYMAARAAPSASSAPPRKFCEMCGFWGRARCNKCGARVCGLECKKQHEETKCQKYYA